MTRHSNFPDLLHLLMDKLPDQHCNPADHVDKIRVTPPHTVRVSNLISWQFLQRLHQLHNEGPTKNLNLWAFIYHYCVILISVFVPNCQCWFRACLISLLLMASDMSAVDNTPPTCGPSEGQLAVWGRQSISVPLTDEIKIRNEIFKSWCSAGLTYWSAG